MFELDENLAYLAGVIVGDGNLSNYLKSKSTDFAFDYRIAIESDSEEFINHILNTFRIYINTQSKPILRLPKNRKPRWLISIRSKAFFIFMSEQMGIPKGNKCRVVRVPELIRKSGPSIKRFFLAGYYDTDGGRRGSTIGFTSASNQLIEDVSLLLDELGYCHNNEVWVNRKYGRQYFGIRLARKSIQKFLNEVPVQNPNKRGCRSGQTGQITMSPSLGQSGGVSH